MLKSLLPYFGLVLAALITIPLLSRGAQKSAPAPAPAPALSQEAPVTVTPPAPTKNPVKPTAESQAKAKSLYQMDCALCHGDNGNGKTEVATSMNLTMDDWTDPKSLGGKQDGELFNIIRNGKDKMPPEAEGRAKDVEVWNLIIYIRSFTKGQQPVPASAGATSK